MPPRSVPPPPRPEPVTLDQIYDQLTRTDTGMDSKAYHLVALNTIAFNPSVKLFFYEGCQQRTRSSSSAAVSVNVEDRHAAAPPTQAVLDADRARREALLKSIAFFLAQRLHPVSLECRWETVSLLGELCRMENTHKNAPTTPQGLLEAKLNDYAKLNLEYLACQLPWFIPAVKAILGEEAVAELLAEAANSEDNRTTEAGGSAQKDAESGARDGNNSSSSSSKPAAAANEEAMSRQAIRDRLRARREHMRGGGGGGGGVSGGGGGVSGEDGAPNDHEDEDAVIALGDILRALPLPCGGIDAKEKTPHWTLSRLEQAHDLMFLDASTTMLHLIPNVARTLSNVCAQCGKVSAATTAATAISAAAAAPAAFLRCSSCKAVYYCTAACQREHWTLAHRNACKAYKEKSDTIAAEYEAMNSRGGGKGKAKGGSKTAGQGVALLEVPLEPALFYETRRYLYDHRDASFGTVEFNDYFMRYTVKGS